MSQQMPVSTPESRPVLDYARDVFGDGWIMDLLKERLSVGVQTYGTQLMTFNGRDSRQDAVEELLDAILYLIQALAERSPEGGSIVVWKDPMSKGLACVVDALRWIIRDSVSKGGGGK